MAELGTTWAHLDRAGPAHPHREQLGVFGGLLEIAAAAEDQLLLQPPFPMAMRCLNDAPFSSATPRLFRLSKAGHDGADALNQVLVLLSAGQAFLINS